MTVSPGHFPRQQGHRVNDYRFPRRAHVRKPGDFSRCFASGQRVSGRYFRCLHLGARADDAAALAAGPRLGMAVSRKVDKRAVERNRLRRLIREWFRHHRLGLVPGDFIVTGKPEAGGITAEQLFQDLDTIAKRLGLKREHAAGTMPGSSLPLPSGDGA